MDTIAATTIDHEGTEYGASLDADGTVTITADDVWAGKGYWRDGQIVDCPAVLGGSQDAAEDVFAALDSALGELLEIIRVEGGETAEDYDTGRIVDVTAENGEARVTVAWDSGVRTTQPASLLRVEGTRPVRA